MFSLIAGLFGLLALVLWIWAIVDVSQHYQDDPTKTLLWIIIVLCFPLVGSLIYFWLRNRTLGHDRPFDPDFDETV